MVKIDKKPWQGIRWTLVVHGQRDDDFQKLVTFFNTDAVTCAVVAKEFGKYKIHPHWQCYYELAERTQTARGDMIEILGHDEFHIEKARGTQRANVKYVYGINKHWEIGFVEYSKNCEVPREYKQYKVDFWRNWQPRPFQRELIDIVLNREDRRSIYYVWEPTGNTGKTMLAEYLHIFHGAIVTGGASSDMKHAVKRWQEIAGHYPMIIIVDVARSDRFTHYSAKALESIKNAFFFSGKYESGMAHSDDKPHVIVFANREPNRSNFSDDRWKVASIVNNELKWEQ